MKKDNKNTHQQWKEFGNYLIGKSIGEGTFGKVKIAQHKLTKEKVGIKVLEKSKINDLADTQRVLRQIHILKLVRHPNIIQLYQIIETPKKLFLIMQYLENGQLFDYIVSKKRLKQEQACKLFHQLIDGIQYIHKIGVVHRDLKPQNLLLDYKMNLRIVDFGLSNTYKKNQKLRTACGSPCYAAPQMLKGQAYEGLGVDIWAAGVILFAMVCGYLPFQDNKNQAELYRQIIQGTYSINVSLSDNLKDLIKKILNVDPQQRYTIDQIRKHPWMVNNSQYRKSTKGIVVGYNKIPVDMKILNTLSEMGIDVEKAQSCLQANRHNNLTTTYYLALKKFAKQGGESIYDLCGKDFDKGLLQPIGSNNRRDGTKANLVLIQNFFTGNGSEGNVRKKSKQKIKQKNERQKQNRQPNHDKSKDLIQHQSKNYNNQKSSILPGKRSRKDSKIGKIDPRIQCSINYGRPSTTKSTQKYVQRESQFQNRLNRRYKQKFNQSLVSKSKDKINHISHQQQSLHQPHQRSRIDSSVTRITNRNQTYQITQIMQDAIQGKQKRTNSKKSSGPNIKSDMLKIAKARWM